MTVGGLLLLGILVSTADCLQLDFEMVSMLFVERGENH